MRKFKQVATVQKALEQHTPTLGKLTKIMGELAVESYMKLWLIDLNEALNLKRPLTETQIDQIAFFIVQEYRNLSIADISLIFKKAKMGRYGDFYESLNSAKILLWFSNYFNERCTVASQLSYQNHLQQKHNKVFSERSSAALKLSDHQSALYQYKYKHQLL